MVFTNCASAAPPIKALDGCDGAWPSKRRRILCAPAAAAAGDGDALPDAPPDPGPLPFSFQTSQGHQLAYIHAEGAEALFGPAVQTYVRQLLDERATEAAMFPQPPAGDTAAAAEPAVEGDLDSWETDPVLLQRMAEVREAERGLILQEILYMCAAERFRVAGLRLIGDLTLLGPLQTTAPAATINAAALTPVTGVLGPPPPAAAAVAAVGGAAAGTDAGAAAAPGRGLVSPAAGDAICSYVRSSLLATSVGRSPDTPMAIDRSMAARLYLGVLEFGYFTRGLEALAQHEGLDPGHTSSVLIDIADRLEEEQLRVLCRVASEDTWLAAVRHTGGLFELQPCDDPYDLLALPFPALATTLTSIQPEPAANIWEHFARPGSAGAARRAAAAAKAKEARGWQADPVEALPPLPEPDLLEFQLTHFETLLLEGACLGAALWESEHEVMQRCGYPLRARRPLPSAATPGGSGT